MADELLFEKSGAIATITLNRPEKLNTFHSAMLADWAAALAECQADDDIAVVILTGAGRAFCAGGDLGTLDEVEGNAALYIGDYLCTLSLVPSMHSRNHIFAPLTVTRQGREWTWPSWPTFATQRAGPDLRRATYGSG